MSNQHDTPPERVQELEDALNEIYHTTDCTTGQMEIINSVLPQRVDDGSNDKVRDAAT